jgi:hypothetical protein
MKSKINLPFKVLTSLMAVLLSPSISYAISTDPLTDLANQMNTSFPQVILIAKLLMWAIIIFCLVMAMFKFKTHRGDAGSYIMAVIGVLFVYVVFEVFF